MPCEKELKNWATAINDVNGILIRRLIELEAEIERLKNGRVSCTESTE